MATKRSAPATVRRCEDEKRALLPRLEALSAELCQTTPYLIGAMERAGLTVVLLEERERGRQRATAPPRSTADE